MPRNNKNKVKILKAKGGADASKADFGTGVSARDANMGMAGKTGKPDISLRGGTGGNSNVQTNQVTVKSGPVQVPTIGPLSYTFNKISRSLYNRKNLKDQKDIDALGGEMLTTGTKTTGNVTTRDGGGDRRQVCPDGTFPPCKAPATQIKKPVTKPKFLSGFQAFDDGGEVVISSNVDKSLL